MLLPPQLSSGDKPLGRFQFPSEPATVVPSSDASSHTDFPQTSIRLRLHFHPSPGEAFSTKPPGQIRILPILRYSLHFGTTSDHLFSRVQRSEDPGHRRLPARQDHPTPRVLRVKIPGLSCHSKSRAPCGFNSFLRSTYFPSINSSCGWPCRPRQLYP